MNIIKMILSHFWIPILILGCFLIFIRQINISGVESKRVMLGIILGVILGFGADIAKRGYDDLVQEQRLKKTAMKLLAEDAKGIYRSIWLWDKVLKSKDIPDNAKKGIPAELNLRYWNKLKENNDFLMLAIEEPFTSIFEKMWNFEKINRQIRLAKSGDSEARSFAIAFYKIVAHEEAHKKLLLLFINEQEINELEKHI